MKLINLNLIFPDKDYVKYLRPITNTQIFEESGKATNSEGLYSNVIFGPYGSESRMAKFGYIDLRIDVVHPLIYNTIISLSSFYKGIISGNTYATFDKKSGMFLESDISNGDSGYEFFFSHIFQLKFERTSSKKRDKKIELIEKYQKKNTIFNSKLLVLPAGLRDYSIDKNERVVEDDINDLYRSVINLSRFLTNINTDDLKSLDQIRFRLQTAIGLIYDHLMTMIDGKKKFIQEHWTSRAIDFGTRNVASGIPLKIANLEDDDIPSITESRCGIFQYIKAIDPIAKYEVNKLFISNVFKEGTDNALVVDKDSLVSKRIEVLPKFKDMWLTNDGLDSIMNKMLDDNIKNSPILIGTEYFGIVSDTGSKVTFYTNSALIPDDVDKDTLRPITYGEMFYISIYRGINKYPGLITRFPVAGQGSIYTTNLRIDTTPKSRTVIFNYVSEMGEESFKINNYPNTNSPWINALNVNYSRLSGLGADFDGDKFSLTVLFSEDAREEIDKLMNSVSYYITADGLPTHDFSDAPTELVMKTMSRR